MTVGSSRLQDRCGRGKALKRSRQAVQEDYSLRVFQELRSREPRGRRRRQARVEDIIIRTSST